MIQTVTVTVPNTIAANEEFVAWKKKLPRPAMNKDLAAFVYPTTIRLTEEQIEMLYLMRDLAKHPRREATHLEILRAVIVYAFSNFMAKTQEAVTVEVSAAG